MEEDNEMDPKKQFDNERYYMLNKALIKNKKLADEQMPDEKPMTMFSPDPNSQTLDTSKVDPVIVSSLKSRIASEPDEGRRNILNKKLTDYMGSLPTINSKLPSNVAGQE